MWFTYIISFLDGHYFFSFWFNLISAVHNYIVNLYPAFATIMLIASRKICVSTLHYWKSNIEHQWSILAPLYCFLCHCYNLPWHVHNYFCDPNCPHCFFISIIHSLRPLITWSSHLHVWFLLFNSSSNVHVGNGRQKQFMLYMFIFRSSTSDILW